MKQKTLSSETFNTLLLMIFIMLVVLAPNRTNGDCTYGDICLVGGGNIE